MDIDVHIRCRHGLLRCGLLQLTHVLHLGALQAEHVPQRRRRFLGREEGEVVKGREG